MSGVCSGLEAALSHSETLTGSFVCHLLHIGDGGLQGYLTYEGPGSSWGWKQASAWSPSWRVPRSPCSVTATFLLLLSHFASFSRTMLARVSVSWWRTSRRLCGTLTPWSWMILALAYPSLMSTYLLWTTRTLLSTSKSVPAPAFPGAQGFLKVGTVLRAIGGQSIHDPCVGQAGGPECRSP